MKCMLKWFFLLTNKQFRNLYRLKSPDDTVSTGEEIIAVLKPPNQKRIIQ